MNWDAFTVEVDELAKKIDTVPDLVIGIARGGVIPAVLLSKSLDVKDMQVIKVRKEGSERKVVADILTDVAGKKVLLVEDMLETGKSLIVAKDYLEQHGTNVKTACLYTMAFTEIKPDYFLREVTVVQHFPWE